MSMSNGVKMEGEFSNVKMDPDAPSPGLADVDEYEDTGELIMPKKVQTWAAEPEIPAGWLLRIPKELWARLADLPMDEEIHIGNVKVWDVQGKQKTRLELNQNLPGLEKVSKQYDMTPTESTTKKDKDPSLRNSFIFSEKNMPGFKRNKDGRGAIGQGVDSKTGGPVKIEKPRQRGPRTIPKHTEMLGQIKAEFICTPRDNDEYQRIRAAKEEAEKSKHRKYTLVSGEQANNLAVKAKHVGSFETSGPTAEKKKKKAQENKATRMPEAELMDALANLFRRYRFWPLASLKKELNQPTDYLKEVLQKIGLQIKTGQAANHWTLNDTYLESLRLGDELRQRQHQGVEIKSEELAPEVEDADGDVSMDEGEGKSEEDNSDDDEVFDDAV